MCCMNEQMNRISTYKDHLTSFNFIQFTELREARQLDEDQTTSGGNKKSRFF